MDDEVIQGKARLLDILEQEQEGLALLHDFQQDVEDISPEIKLMLQVFGSFRSCYIKSIERTLQMFGEDPATSTKTLAGVMGIMGEELTYSQTLFEAYLKETAADDDDG